MKLYPFVQLLLPNAIKINKSLSVSIRTSKLFIAKFLLVKLDSFFQ